MRPFNLKHLFLLALLTISYAAKADTTDNFQVYIKKALVCNDAGLRYPWNKNNFITLKAGNNNETIDISFNHYSPAATNRRIKLVSPANEFLLEWDFPDKKVENLMRISIDLVLKHQKIKPGISYHLYYYDDQLDDGRLLMNIQVEKKPGAKIKQQ
jgi:hypothetical protein